MKQYIPLILLGLATVGFIAVANIDWWARPREERRLLKREIDRQSW